MKKFIYNPITDRLEIVVINFPLHTIRGVVRIEDDEQLPIFGELKIEGELQLDGELVINE